MLTHPTARGRPRTTSRTAAARAATSPQPGPTKRIAATTQVAAAIQRRRVGIGRPIGANVGAAVTSAGADRRSRATRSRQARTASAVRISAIVSGVWAVQCTDTATGPLDGGIHQPLNPPSTSCGGPRLPAAVDADQESWKPSPSTSQQPSGQRSTVTSRPVRDCDVTVAVGPSPAAPGVGRSGAASTTRSTSRPVSSPFAVASRWRAGGQRQRSTRRTARPSTGVAGQQGGRRALHPHRQRRTVDRDEVVATPAVERGGDGGRDDPGELADRGRLDDRLAVAAVEHDVWIDADDRQLHRSGRQRSRGRRRCWRRRRRAAARSRRR